MNITRFRNTLVAAAVAGALGAGVSACDRTSGYSSQGARSSSVTEVLSDTGITTQVKAKLAIDGSIRSSDISVSTVDGVVTLAGSTSDAAARSAAERAAESITGVTSVYNRLSVLSSDTIGAARAGDAVQEAMSDIWITTKVKSLLVADREAYGFDVGVETSNGVVVLDGALRDQSTVDHVKEIAAGVEGVKGVNITSLTVNRQR